MPAKGVRMQVATQQESGVVVDGVRRVLGGRVVLDGLDLVVPLHGRLGVVGRSGSGKSTLLGLVAGLEVAGGGALMPQKDCLLPWRSALDNACLALENSGVDRRTARRRAADLFARVGLAGTEQLRPSELSGGMRQRVA